MFELHVHWNLHDWSGHGSCRSTAEMDISEVRCKRWTYSYREAQYVLRTINATLPDSIAMERNP
jgi:hypothetical protein